MKKYYRLGILLLFIVKNSTTSPIISVFFRPLPDAKKITSKLKNPGKIAKHTINGIVQHNPVEGVCVLYAGFITYSDHNGEVRFPRKQISSTVTLIVTQEITPISLFGNTIDHWEVTPRKKSQFYLCTQEQDDENTIFWNKEPIEAPSNNTIPLSSLVIIAKPSNIIIPSGKTPVTESANLVLPTIYVKKGINIASHSSYILTFRHLFRSVTSQSKEEPLRISTILSE
jgi:hypothetical protein